jgi:hypothetical protein
MWGDNLRWHGRQGAAGFVDGRREDTLKIIETTRQFFINGGFLKWGYPKSNYPLDI